LNASGPSPAKACSVNPLKLSPALGGALAFLGIEKSLPLFHGSQGCTAFALVLMVRHFREAIPLQTTAMSELSTILGGADNVEQAIANIYGRAKPRLIGICSTALTETRGEDMAADLREMRGRRLDWDDLDVVYASTPDYAGSLAEGWARAVEAVIDDMVPASDGTRILRQVNLLAGSHLTPGDVEALKDLIEGFGLMPIVLPDLSDSLDGHVPDDHVPTSLGGVSTDAIRAMGRSVVTLAVGEHMRRPADLLQRRTGVPFRLFDGVLGLEATDALVRVLMEVSGQRPSARLKRDRSRLIDAMLDGHFFFEGRSLAIAGEADLVFSLATFLDGMGARVASAVLATPCPKADRLPAADVVVGDLDDLEQRAPGADLIIANAHAQEAASRLGLPLFRLGFPIYDRLGSAQKVTAGYRGTRDLVFELANLFADRARGDHGIPSHGRGTHPERRDRSDDAAQAC
jgi:nitrogenase molybdenum-iron protein NifN